MSALENHTVRYSQVEESGEDSKACLLEEYPIYESGDDVPPTHRDTLVKRWRMNLISIVIVILLLYVSVILTLNFASQKLHKEQCNTQKKGVGNVLLGDALEYELRPEFNGEDERFALPPGDELDDVWEELMTASTIRVTPEEMDIMKENTTDRARIVEGDYAGILGVFHDLHCLDTLRRLIHWDYYGPRASDRARKALYTTEHYDHCFEWIRQALMCHPNMVFYSAEWIADSSQPLNKALRSNAKTQCVKWESLDGWARSRALLEGEYQFRAGPYEKHRKHGGGKGE